MSTESNCLEGHRLSHGFGQGAARAVVLRDVTLRLRPGEMVLVMGPSGSGKSTLLAVLSGLMRPEGGQVQALGQDLWRASPAVRKRFRLSHFGFIFQGYNLFPALTARQQLEIVLRWGEGMAAEVAKSRAEKMLTLLGLGGKQHLRPAQLSGGEKQRVAIGRALVKEPKLIFADEPTSALDWEHGQQVVKLLQLARSRGSAVFVVSHDARIVPFADRVIHLEDGRLSGPEHLHRLRGALDRDLVVHDRVGLRGKVRRDHREQVRVTLALVDQGAGERCAHRSALGADQKIDVRDLVALTDERLSDHYRRSHDPSFLWLSGCLRIGRRL